MPSQTADGGGTTTQATSAFTCWDGKGVGSADQCKPIHGQRGFYWIFPGMKHQNCRPRTADNTPGRLELMECYVHDRRVRIHLSLWDRADSGVSHYTSEENLGAPAVNVDANGAATVYGWNGTAYDPDYQYKAVILWASHAYSAAVYAVSSAELLSVLQNSNLLTPVPDDRYYGTPAG